MFETGTVEKRRDRPLDLSERRADLKVCLYRMAVKNRKTP
jgi:hypothetical protein